jgi:hypothetical protein
MNLIGELVVLAVTAALIGHGAAVALDMAQDWRKSGS